ncbi:hypothetical protein FPQ18DRAFT_305095 [Pyronema domesticum]|nr:hypothetical protein FPQ18DRAFT_305095 [Pyronema domesticum]
MEFVNPQHQLVWTWTKATNALAINKWLSTTFDAKYVGFIKHFNEHEDRARLPREEDCFNNFLRFRMSEHYGETRKLMDMKSTNDPRQYFVEHAARSVISAGYRGVGGDIPGCNRTSIEPVDRAVVCTIVHQCVTKLREQYKARWVPGPPPRSMSEDLLRSLREDVERMYKASPYQDLSSLTEVTKHLSLPIILELLARCALEYCEIWCPSMRNGMLISTASGPLEFVVRSFCDETDMVKSIIHDSTVILFWMRTALDIMAQAEEREE